MPQASPRFNGQLTQGVIPSEKIMEPEGSFKTFFDAVTKESAETFFPQKDTKAFEEFKEVVGNSLYDLDGPRRISERASDKAYFVANKLFHPLSEIMNNLEAIENISIYSGSFPYKRHGVSRISYLRYNIENYLNELYILKNRMIDYLKIIERSYRKCNRVEEIKKTLKPLYVLVSSALEGYVNVRGAHVHKNRYTDSEIDRLVELELFSNLSDSSELGQLLHSQFILGYRETRKKWVKKMKDDLQALNKLVDIYFENLCEVLINNNRIQYPSNTNWV